MKGSESRESEGRSHFRPGRLIIASQIALSLVLLVVAGLFLRSFTNLATVDAGFDRTNVLIISANLHNANLPPEQRPILNQQILAQLKSLPGVVSVSQSILTPLGNSGWNNDFLLPSGNGPKGDDALINMNYVSPGYFTTLRSPIRAGRDFDEHDIVGAPSVAIINETMSRRYFPNSNPIGQYVLIDDMPGTHTPPFQIVGVLKDAKYRSLREDYPPTIYFPIAQIPAESAQFVSGTPKFEIRTSSDAASFDRSAEEIITGANKAITLQFNTLEEQVDNSLRQEQLLATLSGFFGGLALFLAMIGLYGVLAYTVTQRRKEIGIRMALGAASGSILRLIFRDVAILLAAGLTVGLGLSLWATRLVQTMLYELSSRDTNTIALAAALLAVVALFAGYLPARRASRMDPNAILRDE
jgi:predicted permease